MVPTLETDGLLRVPVARPRKEKNRPKERAPQKGKSISKPDLVPVHAPVATKRLWTRQHATKHLSRCTRGVGQSILGEPFRAVASASLAPEQGLAGFGSTNIKRAARIGTTPPFANWCRFQFQLQRLLQRQQRRWLLRRRWLQRRRLQRDYQRRWLQLNQKKPNALRLSPKMAKIIADARIRHVGGRRARNGAARVLIAMA